MGSAIFEPLLVENGDGTLEPWLAESVTPNEDATSWTIVVREGITFHDGTALDAEAVAANIEARRTSPLTRIANEPITDVEVTDERTVVVAMNRPWAAYDHTLAAVGGYIAAPTMIAEGATDPIGTGPFRFVEWVPQSHLTVERYPEYWRDPAHLDGITFRFLTDVITRTAALEAGDVHAILTPDPDAIRKFRDADGFQSFEHSSEPMHVLLNTAEPPLDDRSLRRALALGTDPATLITIIGGDGVLRPATSPFVSSNPWHLEDNGWPEPDREEARRLVASYESETAEQVELTLKGSSGQEESLAAGIVEQWEAIGIDASFERLEQATLIQDVVFGNFSAALWRNHNWVDPDFNYIFWHSSTLNPVGELSINFSHLTTPELDEALDAGRSTIDPEARREAYDEVQRILNEEAAHIWLFEVVWAVAASDKVHGWDDLAARGLSRLEPKVFYADLWMT